MKTNQLLLAILLSFLAIQTNAQTNYGGEIVSYQKFGEGLMVTKAKIIPLSGTVTNIFFFNRQDQPWNDNVWYEYDWEIRGKYPNNGWSQIRVREEQGGQLKDAPVNVSTSEDLSEKFYNYILIRKGDDYIYDIREDFNINSYDYTKSAAHNGNSASIIVGGPRVYTTGGNVADIPQGKQLDFSLGITAFDNGWTGSLPNGAYNEEVEIDYARFYGFSNNGQLNNYTQWSDEFNSNQIDYGKWQIANWEFAKTQFVSNNVRLANGKLYLRINREGNSNTSFTPDPNKVYHIDAPKHNTRLAATGNAEDPYTTSTSTTGANVEWKFVAKGNGSWHIQRAAGGSTPRLRTRNNNGEADMQATSSSGTWTYWDFAPSSAIDNTYYFTLPDRPSNYSRLQIDSGGDVNMVSNSKNGTWESFKITEVSGNSQPPTVSSNLALNGNASQSTTSYGGNASRAIDNNTNGKWGNGSVTHTSNQNNTWWQVALQQNSNINQIEIYNRTDNCCTSRLDDFTVSVLNENGSVVWSQFYSNTPTPNMTINLNTTGKTVRVSLNGTLSLAEVKVFGTPLNSGRIEEITQEETTIYPNPTREKLFIDLSLYMDKEVNLMVSDLSGKQQIVKTFQSDHSSIAELDMGHLDNGLYILYIKARYYRAVVEKIYVNHDF